MCCLTIRCIWRISSCLELSSSQGRYELSSLSLSSSAPSVTPKQNPSPIQKNNVTHRLQNLEESISERQQKEGGQNVPFPSQLWIFLWWRIRNVCSYSACVMPYLCDCTLLDCRSEIKGIGMQLGWCEGTAQPPACRTPRHGRWSMGELPATPALQTSGSVNPGRLQCEIPSKRNKGMEIMFLGIGRGFQKKQVYKILAHNRN